MSARTPIDPALESKQLYIKHLAQRLESMELGRTPLRAIDYRLYARRLREATASYPAGRLAATLSAVHPTVAEMLAARYFDAHGQLPGRKAKAVRATAEEALRRYRGLAA